MRHLMKPRRHAKKTGAKRHAAKKAATPSPKVRRCPPGHVPGHPWCSRKTLSRQAIHGHPIYFESSED